MPRRNTLPMVPVSFKAPKRASDMSVGGEEEEEEDFCFVVVSWTERRRRAATTAAPSTNRRPSPTDEAAKEEEGGLVGAVVRGRLEDGERAEPFFFCCCCCCPNSSSWARITVGIFSVARCAAARWGRRVDAAAATLAVRVVVSFVELDGREGSKSGCAVVFVVCNVDLFWERDACLNST